MKASELPQRVKSKSAPQVIAIQHSSKGICLVGENPTCH